MSEMTISLDSGDRLDCLSYGEGEAVVLLPSLGRDNSDFDTLGALIAKSGYRVLCPNPRGLSDALPQTETATLYTLAGDVAQLLDALGIDRAVVAGHAFGNWIARAFARSHPEKTRGVVLLAAARDEYINPALRQGIDIVLDARNSDKDRLDALRQVYFSTKSNPAVWLEGWNLPLARFQRKVASRTDLNWKTCGLAPVLDVQAAEDPFLRAVPDHSLQILMGDRVKVSVIQNASHALVPEQSEAIASAMIDFIRALD